MLIVVTLTSFGSMSCFALDLCMYVFLHPSSHFIHPSDVVFSSSPVFWPHVGRYSVVVQFKSQQSVLCRDGGAGRVRDTLNTQQTIRSLLSLWSTLLHIFRRVCQHTIFMMIFYSSHNNRLLAITMKQFCLHESVFV